MALTEQDLVQRVRVELEETAWQDFLTAQLNVAAASMSVGNPTKWSEGDLAEPDDGKGELLFVKADAAGNPVTIQKAYNGTVDQQHANGTAVRKSPRWTYQQIVAALNSETLRLWPHAWLEGGPASVAPVTGIRWYALPAGAKDLIAVYQLRNAISLDFLSYGDGQAPPVAFDARHPSLGTPAIGFPQGFALMTQNVKVTYRKAPLVLADVEDGAMAEAVVLGACERLLTGEETERVGEDVNAGELGVPPGSRLRSAAWFHQQREDKLHDLRLQLLKDRAPMATWRR